MPSFERPLIMSSPHPLILSEFSPSPTILTMNDTQHANTQAFGEFEVDMQPLEGYAIGVEGITLGRMSIDKRFTGDLAATSQGEMLSALTGTSGVDSPVLGFTV